MAAPDFSHKWETLRPAERRVSGIRLGEFADPAAEAQAIALTLREALETPGKTAALVTPDRQLATRVSALLARWGIEADDSAGKALVRDTGGDAVARHRQRRRRRAGAGALLALLKHPLAGGEGDERVAWLDAVRELDLKLRGPRPAAGLAGLDEQFAAKRAWQIARRRVEALDGMLREPMLAGSSLREASRMRRKRWPTTGPGAGPRGGWQQKCWPSSKRRLRPRA